MLLVFIFFDLVIPEKLSFFIKFGAALFRSQFGSSKVRVQTVNKVA
jgi:hypothetical protein